MLSMGGVVDSDRAACCFRRMAMYCLWAEGGNMLSRAGRGDIKLSEYAYFTGDIVFDRGRHEFRWRCFLSG